MDKSENAINQLLKNKSNLYEVVFIAILLSLSINLVSSSLPALLHLSNFSSFILGLSIGSVAVIYLIVRLVGAKHKSIALNGFFIYETDSNKVISIPRYRYAEKLSKYLNAIFAENEAIKTMWDKEPLKNQLEVKDDGISVKHLRSHDLINEATEYFILDELSLHLSDYFNNEIFTDGYIKEFNRTDIPDILFSNHFLDTFSRPMDERSPFVEHKGSSVFTGVGKIVSATGKGGAIFDDFELTLPAKSSLKRISNNELEIDTNRFRITLSTDFKGINTYIPFEFFKYYLGMDKPVKTIRFSVKIKIEITFKLSAFTSTSGWNYYHWFDSFTDKISSAFEKKSFFNFINWEESLMIIEYMNRRENKSKKQKTT